MRWMVPIVVLALGCGSKDDESRTKLAKLQVQKFASELYPHWALIHVDKQCPDSIDELTKDVGADLGLDPWKHPLVILCGASAAGREGLRCGLTREGRQARHARRCELVGSVM